MLLAELALSSELRSARLLCGLGSSGPQHLAKKQSPTIILGKPKPAMRRLHSGWKSLASPAAFCPFAPGSRPTTLPIFHGLAWPGLFLSTSKDLPKSELIKTFASDLDMSDLPPELQCPGQRVTG